MDRRTLARRLEDVRDFEEPELAREQYRTPPELAAHLLHLAAMRGDVAGRTVIDLGSGTGMLALGAALLGPDRVVGVEIDPGAVGTARENERAVAPPASVAWVRGDATRPPLNCTDATVVSNPPFGAVAGHEGADRAFLLAAADLGRVSYTVHNAGSRDFVESLAADNGGEVTDAVAAEFDVERRFAHHDSARETLDVEVYRVVWS